MVLGATVDGAVAGMEKTAQFKVYAMELFSK